MEPDPTRDADERLDVVERRIDFLEATADEPLRKRAMVDRLDVSRSTVDRAVRELQGAGLLRRTDGGYRPTLAGRLAADRYLAYLSEGRSVLDAADLLAPLDADDPLDPAILVDADVALSPETTPHRPLDDLYDAVREADAYRAALPTLADDRHLRLCYELVVTEGNAVELLVDESLFGPVREAHPRRLPAMAAADGFELRVGDAPPFSVAVTRDGDAATAWVVVFRDDGSLHGVLRNDDPAAVEWATGVLDELRERATDRTESLGTDGRGAADGGAALATEGRAPVPEGEGFVRVDGDYFADRAEADPETAWRAGLDLVEVHAGYAVDRTADAEGDASLTERLVDRLAAGEDCAVLGPPGSGKSTLCKRVAVRWYREGKPVLYREGRAGDPFTSVRELARAAAEARGHALVVVEDAMREDANAVFDLLDALAERSGEATVLLDARESEWHDPPEGVEGLDRVRTMAMPPLLDRDCARLVEEFERTTGERVEIPGDELRAELREDLAGRDRAAPGEALLLLHRLSACADPLAEGPTSLDEDVADTRARLARLGEAAVDVGLLVNALNAANLPVTPALLHAAVDAPPGAIERALAELRGDVLFGGDDGPTERTIHEAWSVEYLARAAEGDDAGARFEAALERLLSLADRPERLAAARDRADATPVLDRIASAPERWLAETTTQVFDLGRRRPVLADLLAPPGSSGLDLPAAAPPAVADGVTARRAWTLRYAGEYDRAATAFERLADADPDAAVRAANARAERALGLCEVERARGNPEAATAHARACVAAADGDEATTALGELELGRIAVERGRYEAARRRLASALASALRRGREPTVAAALRALGDCEFERERTSVAESLYRESLRLRREGGDRRGEAAVRLDVSAIANRRGDAETRAAEATRALDLARAVGDRSLETKALSALCDANNVAGDYGEAARMAEEALRLAREIGDRTAEASALTGLGMSRHMRDEFDAAEARYREALELRRELGHREREAMLLVNLSITAEMRGALDRAADYAAEALDCAASIDASYKRLRALLGVGAVHVRRGDLDAAERRLDEAAELAAELEADRVGTDVTMSRIELCRLRGRFTAAREHGDRAVAAYEDRDRGDRLAGAHKRLAKVERDRGNLEAAASLGREALEAMTADGDDRGVANARLVLGETARRDGRLGDAREHLRAGLDLSAEIDHREGRVRGHVGLGLLAAADDDPEAARDHLREAERLADEMGARVQEARALAGLGRLARDADRLDAARDRLEAAAERLRAAGANPLLADVAADLAATCRERGDAAAAAEWQAVRREAAARIDGAADAE